MLALFFVTLFRNDDDKNETDNDEDDRKELNKYTKRAEDEMENENPNFGRQGVSTLTQIEIEELKIKQSKRNKSKKLTREIFINIIFVFVLFVACYSNRDDNAFSYNTHIKALFQDYKLVYI